MTDESHPIQHSQSAGAAGAPSGPRWSRAALLRVGIILPASILLAVGAGRLVGRVAQMAR